MTCQHDDRPKTHYVTQGGTQISSPSAACSTNGNGLPLPVFHGLLCDVCAKTAGLMPTAFGRELVTEP